MKAVRTPRETGVATAPEALSAKMFSLILNADCAMIGYVDKRLRHNKSCTATPTGPLSMVTTTEETFGRNPRRRRRRRRTRSPRRT